MFIVIIIVIIFTIVVIIVSIRCHASRVNARCIIVLYNSGFTVPIRLSGRGSSCLVYTRPGMSGIGMVARGDIILC